MGACSNGGSNHASPWMEDRRLWKHVHDNVHGNIYLDPLSLKFIDTEQFQRLRDLKQLGLSLMVYRFGTFCKQPDYWQDQNCKDFWTKGHYRESQKMIRNLVSILSWLSEGLKMIKRRKYKFWGKFGLFGSLESIMNQWGRILIRGQYLIDLCIQKKGIKSWFVTVKDQNVKFFIDHGQFGLYWKLGHASISALNMKNMDVMAEDFLANPSEYVQWFVEYCNDLQLSKTLFNLILLHSLIKSQKDFGQFSAIYESCFPLVKKEWEKLEAAGVGVATEESKKRMVADLIIPSGVQDLVATLSYCCSLAVITKISLSERLVYKYL